MATPAASKNERIRAFIAETDFFARTKKGGDLWFQGKGDGVRDRAEAIGFKSHKKDQQGKQQSMKRSVWGGRGRHEHMVLKWGVGRSWGCSILAAEIEMVGGRGYAVVGNENH